MGLKQGLEEQRALSVCEERGLRCAILVLDSEEVTQRLPRSEANRTLSFGTEAPCTALRLCFCENGRERESEEEKEEVGVGRRRKEEHEIGGCNKES